MIFVPPYAGCVPWGAYSQCCVCSLVMSKFEGRTRLTSLTGRTSRTEGPLEKRRAVEVGICYRGGIEKQLSFEQAILTPPPPLKSAVFPL